MLYGDDMIDVIATRERRLVLRLAVAIATQQVVAAVSFHWPVYLSFILLQHHIVAACAMGFSWFVVTLDQMCLSFTAIIMHTSMQMGQQLFLFNPKKFTEDQGGPAPFLASYQIGHPSQATTANT